MNPDPAFLPALSLAGGGARRLYTDIRDDEALLAFARRTMTAEGIDAAHIGIANGAMDAIEQALFALAPTGATIALEDPTYPRYAMLAEALRLRVVRMAMDARGITPKALDRALAAGASVLVVTPRAQNPTGASFDAARADELRALLAAVPAVAVIEDDYLAYVCGVPLHSLTIARARFLHVRSLAKTIGPDSRVGPYACDAETFARIATRRKVGTGWVSLMLQEGAVAALRALDATDGLATAVRAYDARRTALLDACARYGLRAFGPAGFVVWIAVADEASALDAAAAAGFRIAAGAPYRGDAPPGVRVTTTTLTDAEAEALARALAAAPAFASDEPIAAIARGVVDRTLPKPQWTHFAHFAAATYVVMCREDLVAEEAMPRLIRAYNEATGVANTDTGGYHETITQASLRAVRRFVAANPNAPLHVVCNAVLASECRTSAWYFTYWSRERLMTPEARRAWVEPDLQPLPA